MMIFFTKKLLVLYTFGLLFFSSFFVSNVGASIDYTTGTTPVSGITALNILDRIVSCDSNYASHVADYDIAVYSINGDTSHIYVDGGTTPTYTGHAISLGQKDFGSGFVAGLRVDPQGAAHAFHIRIDTDNTLVYCNTGSGYTSGWNVNAYPMTTGFVLYSLVTPYYMTNTIVDSDGFKAWIDPIISFSTDLIYQVNFTLSGSGTGFIAKYKNRVTDPVTTIPEPTSLSWVVIDKNIDDTVSPLGKKIVCEVYDLSILDTFSNANCPGMVFDMTHTYAVVSGVVIGNGTNDGFVWDGITYNITYKMASYDIPITQSIYKLSTIGCSNGDITSEFGYGTNCYYTNDLPICSITDLTNSSQYVDFISCQGSRIIQLLQNLLAFLFIPNTDDMQTMFKYFKTTTFGLEAIITMPLATIAEITTDTCTGVVLPLPFVSTDLTLPCMGTYYTTYLGGLFDLYQTIVTGVISYYVMVQLLHLIKKSTEPGHASVEVLDL
jgi:hypothetical protein